MQVFESVLQVLHREPVIRVNDRVTNTRPFRSGAHRPLPFAADTPATTTRLASAVDRMTGAAAHTVFTIASRPPPFAAGTAVSTTSTTSAKDRMAYTGTRQAGTNTPTPLATDAFA